MTELPSYLPIELETTTFDLIVVGTGIPESVIAAAASASGKTVLHLDPNSFYGSHSASSHLNDLISFLNYHATLPSTTAANTTSASSSHDFTALNLSLQSLYSNVETANYAPETLAQHSTQFFVDLGGPRGIEASFIWDGSGRLCDVPDSRSAIFKDKSLSLLEKNQLMRFFKLVQQHLGASNGDDEGRESSKISEEDLESPFVEFLKKMRLPPKIKSIILYAICLVDYDQDNLEVCKSVLKTRDGMERLALYQNSIGRYGASGALLYPTYGLGELSQAFCRRAAVKVLRMPVTALLIDQNSGQYKGVRLASGEDLFSHQLVLDPTFIVPLPPASSPPDLRESFQVLSLKDDKRKVARGICIISSSLKPDISHFLLIYPPRSLFPEQDTSIRALQIGGGLDKLAVCPSGMFVLYFSGLCDDAGQGKRLLHAAMNALLTLPISANPESGSAAGSEDAEVKPTLLWSMLYIQELTTLPTGQYENIISTPMLDGNINFSDLIESTVVLFQKMYPDEVFFPETPSSPEVPENSEDGIELSLEN
ncbi:rab proteins geranylgeranyltransferase component A 2 [Prunus yedoensis var. nudiflora]|uniref:Rab proteins geranylgeranyltransferase component A 2 n=1 Tax=Prunus yedoensis var. nudiflora TaxID=2094558 RepID=A0A314YDA8_PRUYE|nr:rab proteins geranylgeranyltransferase component A 2 [Prunus yedoensis var. nudiflora]